MIPTLNTSKSYKAATPAERNAVYNGCGPEWFPDWARKLLDLITRIFKRAIKRHDWDYTYMEKTPENRKTADRRLLKNCFILAWHAVRWYQPGLYTYYCGLAIALYRACRRGGESAFKNGKPKN